MEELYFQTSPNVVFATNTFINVPTILRYENTNLIEIIKESHLGYTTQIPIYHSDGTYLAKINGTRIFPTKPGEKAGLIIEKSAGLTVCKMDKQTLFEIRHQSGDSFRMDAELYTPNGIFIKCRNNEKSETLISGILNKINLQVSQCTFENVRIGLWLKKDGSCLIGVS